MPFFPQDDHQCGPAALATVLAASGVAITPEALTPEVYIPGREGSLQPELLAATRRSGRIPYVLDGTPAALLAELDAGHPVLVLQNFALPAWPRWHYAVVIGYDPSAGDILLRSGTRRRETEGTRTFFRTWDYAGNWAFVALPAGQIPASAEPRTWLGAVLDAASRLPPAELDAAYQAAVARWPDDGLVLFAAANQAYGRGRTERAESLYRQVLAVEPGQVAARNNLASLLLGRGCRAAALQEVDTAAGYAAAAPDVAPAITAALDETRAEILAAPAGAGPPGCPP